MSEQSSSETQKINDKPVGDSNSLRVPKRGKSQEGFRRMPLGAIIVTVISDGTTTRDARKLVTRIPPNELDSVLKYHYRLAQIELSINTFLLDMGSRLVLVDAGAGDLLQPEAGLFSSNCRAAGYDPAEIDAVVLTHIHADHSGGLMRHGEQVFPKATVFVPELDYNYFMDVSQEKKAPEEIQHVFIEARKCIGPYEAANKVKRFRWNEEILPGLSSLPAPGHTPGHSFIAVESQGEKLLIMGDTIHVGEVQFSNPEASVILDIDQEKAATQRRDALEMAADEGFWVGFEHVSFPGVGHVRRDAEGFDWIPMPFAVGG